MARHPVGAAGKVMVQPSTSEATHLERMTNSDAREAMARNFAITFTPSTEASGDAVVKRRRSREPVAGQ